MERKKLIRPITVLKVRKYMEAVSDLIITRKKFSLDRMAREHSISGSIGTAMITCKFIQPIEGISGQYEFVEDAFTVNDHNAVILIEHVRVKEAQQKQDKINSLLEQQQSIAVSTESNSDSTKNQEAGDYPSLKRKSFKTADFDSVVSEVLERIGSSANKQSDIFGGVQQVYEERLKVASAIATGVYGNVSLTDHSGIGELNEYIVRATANLMDKLLNFNTTINNSNFNN